jgi:hypothetical protein
MAYRRPEEVYLARNMAVAVVIALLVLVLLAALIT